MQLGTAKIWLGTRAVVIRLSCAALITMSLTISPAHASTDVVPIQQHFQRLCSMPLQIGGGAGQLPQWATSLIIFGSCVLVTTLVLVAGRLVHHFADRHAGDSPLLLLLLLLLSICSHIVLLIMQASDPGMTVNAAVVGLHVLGPACSSG